MDYWLVGHTIVWLIIIVIGMAFCFPNYTKGKCDRCFKNGKDVLLITDENEKIFIGEHKGRLYQANVCNECNPVLFESYRKRLNWVERPLVALIWIGLFYWDFFDEDLSVCFSLFIVFFVYFRAFGMVFSDNFDSLKESELLLIKSKNMKIREAEIIRRRQKERKREANEKIIRTKQKERQARERESALDYDSAIVLWEGMRNLEEAARVRKLKAEQGAIKVDQTVFHGDQVTKTEIKDSVLNRSNVGAGGKTKGERIKLIKELLDSGAINDDEFKQMKKEILGK